jgi:hypothetical protein
VKPVSLCLPPRPGELCLPVRFELPDGHTSLELTSRHRITAVELHPDTGRVLLGVDITDPQSARPVHVRFSVLDADAAQIGGRAVRLAEFERGGRKIVVQGAYQGVVSDEN